MLGECSITFIVLIRLPWKVVSCFFNSREGPFELEFCACFSDSCRQLRLVKFSAAKAGLDFNHFVENATSDDDI